MANQKVVVEGSSVTASQMKDLWRQIADGSLRFSHIQALLEHRDPFTASMNLDSQLKRWQDLYKDLFGIRIDFEPIKIPEQKKGFNRLIVVPKGITMNKVVEVCRKKFDMHLVTEDLDKEVTRNDRVPTQTYAIWVQDNIEVDPEFHDKSANQLKEENHQGITLLERLLYELVYFTETGKHLDVKKVTLCAGSRRSGGGVPGVSWSPDYRKVYVGCCRPGGRDPDLRSRAVVS